uniref:dockerin type I domain-containing protein n=1 Tax=Ruminococcus sp. TaxID=41978 RepID=UPI003FD86112
DNNSTAQHWYISSENGGYVFIPKCAINSVMDLTGGSTTDGNNIQLYEYNGTAAQIFAIYGQDDVQLKSAVLSVTPGNSKTNTAFNWTKTYGESYYSLKIWNGKELVGEPYYIDSNIPQNTLAKEIQLQPGYYEAYVDAVNYFNCKKSNTVSFTVKPTVKTYIDKTKTSITLEWEQVLNAKSYKVNIYNKDTDELVLSKENIETADCSFTLPNGSYYIVISSDNNVSSDKKYMIVNMNYAKSIIGDINYDGYITMEDVELLTQYLATGNYIDKRIADVNNDELIDVADAIQISRFINGNDTNYNIGKEITLDSLLGDLNSDGKISVNDVTELQMYISQSKDFSDEQKMLADYNQDGIIDVLDVTDIQQLIANS